VDITEVRVKLMSDKTEKLQAFCSITISDDFVVRDLKIIDGTSGPFVAMPSRKLSDRCHKCGCKNHLRANYCSDCGARLKSNRGGRDDKGRTKLHADIAHPINSKCREELQGIVLAAYREEVERSGEAGYVPPKFDDFEEVDAGGAATPTPSPPEGREERPVEPAEVQLETPERSHPAAEAPPQEGGEEKLDAELDAALDSSLDDFKRRKEKREEDDFGSGIFT